MGKLFFIFPVSILKSAPSKYGARGLEWVGGFNNLRGKKSRSSGQLRQQEAYFGPS